MRGDEGIQYIIMVCIKCGSKIPDKSKSVKYCSERCSRLYLKSQYRKRNKDKINAYRRKIRKEGYKNYYKSQRSGNVNKVLSQGVVSCLVCGKREGVEIHHIKPRRAGGKHEMGNIVLLCKEHHFTFEELTNSLWE